jgi:anti-sigma factor RsiW
MAGKLRQVNGKEVKKMQCKDFREISDAYLSDELLVETNIQVFQHLEDCRKCRQDFADRRVLRQQLRTAVLKSDEFAIDPFFANRLKLELKDEALKNKGWFGGLISPRILVPLMSLALIVGIFSFVLLRFGGGNAEIAGYQGSIASFLAQVSLQAVGNHKHCAIEKQKLWEAHSVAIDETGAAVAAAVAPPVEEYFGGNVEVLHAHDCVYNGKSFSHVILKTNGHLVSVFVDKSGAIDDPQGSPPDSIVSERENGLQVASFYSGRSAVFVVSDLPETDNLNAARKLLDALKVSNV